ncbi:NUDIX hydrolase [Streptomyces poonensis]|uniref:NUDIX hydrolase n=1 Tax=Streptomyces poonensis TaxID=68255 RepID=UPI001E3C9354|nr:NUDIX domain-containing protein [Streptomyces poonensis]
MSAELHKCRSSSSRVRRRTINGKLTRGFLRLPGQKSANPPASPGGGIDPGEQPVEALARELLEETGLELTEARLLHARTYAVRRHGVSGSLTALFYAVALKGGAPTVTETDGSTEAAVWVSLADLQDDTVLSPAAADALRLLDRAKASVTATR